MQLGRRFAAGCVDAVISLLACAVLLMPFASLVDARLWATLRPVPLLWATVFMGLGIAWQGNTPGKTWLKLRVTGHGCMACRELRRSGWLVLLGVSQLFGTAAPDWVTMGAAFAAAVWLALLILWPALRRAPEFPHNTATGYTVIG